MCGLNMCARVSMLAPLLHAAPVGVLKSEVRTAVRLLLSSA